MGGVSLTPGCIWGSLLPLVAVMSLGAAVPVVFHGRPPYVPLPPIPHHYDPPATPDPDTSHSTLSFPMPRSGTTNRPPTPFTLHPTPPRPPTTQRPHCWNPEECCVHPYDSEKFDECCEEHGCCPTECPVTLPGGVLTHTERCKAWECCVHREGSQNHQECCKKHGCCPYCGSVSSGCCYNGLNYAFGSIVLDLPEVCLQLVCAAKLIPHFPYFVATIAPVKTCSFTDMSDACVGCPIHQCVDKTGLVRDEGDKWEPSPCTQCECLFGRVTCRSLFVDCRPPPHPGCIAMPGPCCPVYHCDDGCIDNGVFRPLGSQWPSADPCLVFVCGENGVSRVVIDCKPPPQPHEGCHLQRVDGQCCPEWNCSRCLDSDGTFHPLNDVWQSGPCLVKECRERGVVVRPVACPSPGDPPHRSCFLGVAEGDCCEAWQCDGCWDGGVLHPPGDVWSSDDPCFNHVCTGQGAVLRPVDCPDFPKPHESCFEFTPEGKCCPTWNCSGCLDSEGNFHPQFEEWQSNPCTVHVCHLDGITTKAITCPQIGPAPHYTCHTVPTGSGCCKEWKCDGCFDDNGLFHTLGTEWVSKENPCKRLRCTKSGITSFLIACDPKPPAHEGCFLESVEGQCCQRWNCSGCVDDDGIFHLLYHEWKTDPCTTHICTESGIQMAQVSCLPPLRPHTSCKLVSLPGVCCQVWDCKYGRSYLGCHEDDQYYEDGEEWTTDDPCEKRRCMSGTIATESISCSMVEPPTANCLKEDHIEECCPTWNCSGCVDDDGVFHKLGEEWSPNPCQINSCSESGINYILIDCPEEHPDPGCHLVTDPDECCPRQECSGCVDQHGDVRQDGEEWPSSDPCLVFRCVLASVEPHLVQCNETRPSLPICFPSIEKDLCCPTWNCSGCLDKDGVFHPIGESWPFFPCATLTCTSEGVVTAIQECPGPPHPGCVPEPLLPDQCCPEWRCNQPPYKLDCSNVGCQGPPAGHDCKPHRPPGRCCPVYHCRSNKPLDEKCAAVLCLGPEPGKTCTAYTPEGECCPVYDCQ
ncbi:kielin/chordin-like protein [Eriocheir sinensis]|uniref:kielin/chordin-like protein n=1 Tax=Eriocheir sinensis TaxID=95602 RepID=UPI0021CA65DF|nr:kielin/chordin-like protein [Eriocheir sinensis]